MKPYAPKGAQGNIEKVEMLGHAGDLQFTRMPGD